MEFVSADINNAIAVVRRHLYRSIYNNACFLSDMSPLIAENLDCENITYNADNYSFTIKLKADAHISNITDIYYIINVIFYQFIKKNYDKLLGSIGKEYSNPEDVLQLLFSIGNACSAFGNISHVSNNFLIMSL